MKKRPTVAVFEKQKKKLENVVVELTKEGLPLTNKNLITGLEKKGLKVDRDKLNYLRQALNKGDNFVLGISESQYSAMIRDIYDKICIIEDECFELAKKDWTQHEEETSEGDGTANDRQSYTRNKTIDNEHKPKHDFYKLALDCQTAKTKIMSGDIINASIALIEPNFNRLRDENAEYIQEIQRLKEQITELKKPIEN